MKKLVLFFAFVSIVFVGIAQEGLNLGLHYAYNSTWLMNKQVFDEGPEMDPVSSFGSYFGLIAGYSFEDNFGLEINFNQNTLNQDYAGDIKYLLNENRNEYTASTVIKTLDIPILLKFGSASYFEIGPLVQVINKATYTRTFDDTGALSFGYYNDELYAFTDAAAIGVKSDFAELGFGVTMGFGANFNIIEDVLKLNFGLRFNYILSDLEGVNGLGLTKDDSLVPTDDKVNFYNHPLYGGVKLGLIYYFD